MKTTFLQLVAYIKNPTLDTNESLTVNNRLKTFLHLFIISVLTAMVLGPLLNLIEYFELIDLQKHSLAKLIENKSKLEVLLLAAVLAPLLEELIFRAPLTLFKIKHFKIVFYAFAIVFGLVHLSNYPYTTNVLFLAPILILPQVILGFYLGYTRIKLGLLWSMLLHACYNAFFMLIVFATGGIS